MRVLIPLVVAVAAASAQAAEPEVVVIGNPAAQTLTKEQVADLFLGKNQV